LLQVITEKEFTGIGSPENCPSRRRSNSQRHRRAKEGLW